MKIGDRVEILDCVYYGVFITKGNFGVIKKVITRNGRDTYEVTLDKDSSEDWVYLKKELKVIS